MKRLVCSMLVFCMMFTVIPVGALASGDAGRFQKLAVQVAGALTQQETTKGQTESVAAAASVLRRDTKLTQGMTFGSLRVDGVTLDLAGYDVTVEGDLIIDGGTVLLKRATLTVTGNVYFHGGILSIGRGHLNISGSFISAEEKENRAGDMIWEFEDGGQLEMIYAEDEVTVGGDFIGSHGIYDYDNVTAGTLRIAGDVLVGMWASFFYDFNSNRATSGKVILNGTKPQTIACFVGDNTESDCTRGSDGILFGLLEVQNPSSLTIRGGIKIQELTSTQTTLKLNSNTMYVYSISLGTKALDLQIMGDVILDGWNRSDISVLNLRDSSCSIQGNLYQEGGTVSIGRGKLNVEGDYRIARKTENNAGDIVWIGVPAVLEMLHAQGEVNVGGSFTHYGEGDYGENRFVAGTMRVAGDFETDTNTFIPSINHKVILNGTKHQTARFASYLDGPGDSRFGTLQITKPRSQYTFRPDPCWLRIIEGDEYTVTFDPNGGTCATPSKTVAGGSAVSALPTPEWAGHTFTGWYTEKTGGTKVTASTIVTGNVTYYAHWGEPPAVTYTVTFNAGGGSGTMSAVTVKQGEKLTLPACGFTAPANKEFDKWDLGAPGAQVSITKNTTVTAQWIPIPVYPTPGVTYTVTFDPNGGSGTMSAVTVKKGEKLTLPACTLTAPPNRVFETWDLGAPGAQVSITKNTTVKAQWKNSPVDPTPTGATIQVGTVTGRPGTQVKVPITLANNPGIVSIALDVSYNKDVMTLNSVTNSGLMVGSTHSNDLSMLPYRLAWAEDTSADNKGSGTLVTLNFTIKSGAAEGVYPVTVSYENITHAIYNNKMEPVNFAVVNGAVTVQNFLIGDVNGDGEVTPKDRTVLARYLAKWSGYGVDKIVWEASDVNGDGDVTPKDRTVLARYLAKWKGYETLPHLG